MDWCWLFDGDISMTRVRYSTTSPFTLIKRSGCLLAFHDAVPVITIILNRILNDPFICYICSSKITMLLFVLCVFSASVNSEKQITHTNK